MGAIGMKMKVKVLIGILIVLVIAFVLLMFRYVYNHSYDKSVVMTKEDIQMVLDKRLDVKNIYVKSVREDKLGAVDNPVVYSDATFYINNNSADKLPVNGYFGMVKIDDNVYIPTDAGFINRNTGEPLEVYTSGKYTFYPVEKPAVRNNLIKQVNANVKIYVAKEKLKFSHSTFEKTPEFLSTFI